MRTLLAFVALVFVVLVPCSTLAPALLPDASGSAISSSPPKLALAARIGPALGILPLSEHDEPDEVADEHAGTPEASPPAQPAAPLQGPRMICENGVCRLVDDQDQPTASGESPRETTTPLESTRSLLEQLGATQIRVELDSLGRWRCACSLPVRPGSPVLRKFEARGDSDEQAIEQTCRLVEAWLQDRR